MALIPTTGLQVIRAAGRRRGIPPRQGLSRGAVCPRPCAGPACPRTPRPWGGRLPGRRRPDAVPYEVAPARPSACRCSHCKRGTKPAVGPLLHTRESPARTAAASLRSPVPQARSSFTPVRGTAAPQTAKSWPSRCRRMRQKVWTNSSVGGMTGSSGSRRARSSRAAGRCASAVARNRRAAWSAVTGAGRPSGGSAAYHGAGATWRHVNRGPVSRHSGRAVRQPAFHRRHRDGMQRGSREGRRGHGRCRSGGCGRARERDTVGRRPCTRRALAAIRTPWACHRGIRSYRRPPRSWRCGRAVVQEGRSAGATGAGGTHALRGFRPCRERSKNRANASRRCCTR